MNSVNLCFNYKPLSFFNFFFFLFRCGEIPSFGKSLLAGYNQVYIGDFVLQGCQTMDETQLYHDLLKTVKVSQSIIFIVSISRVARPVEKHTKPGELLFNQ